MAPLTAEIMKTAGRMCIRMLDHLQGGLDQKHHPMTNLAWPQVMNWVKI